MILYNQTQRESPEGVAGVKREENFDPEKVIVNVVQSAIDIFQKRVAVHYGKDEISLTADLEEKIEMTLAELYDIHLKREYNMGRALKGLGETDLYFYTIQEDRIVDLAILENKVIEKFRDQYFQLLGYLNSNFLFGMTVSINRHYTLEEARNRIADTLLSLEGEYAVGKEVYFSGEHRNRLMSVHTVPETGEKMNVYHFILNLEDGSRQEAARQGREKSSGSGSGKQDGVLAHFQMIEDVEEKEVQWVIPYWIPKGGITLLVGDGGVGKTNLWSYLISRLSAGLPTMLDNAEYEREASPGNVATVDMENDILVKKINTKCVYFSKEDSTASRLKRNFRMYEANMANIGTTDVEHLAGFHFTSKDLADLISQQRPVLVIFDPVQAFFPPGMSMTSRQQCRETLDVLVRLAQEYSTAFLLVCHTNKKKTLDWRQRINGSADLADIARSVIFTSYTELRIKEKEGCRIRYISNEKNSYAKPELSVLYTIEGEGVVTCVGISGKHFADYVAEEGKRKEAVPKARSQKEICRELIPQMLAGVEKMPMKELNEALDAAGFGKKAADQAKAELEREGVIVRWNEPEGKKPCWYIRLGSHPVPGEVSDCENGIPV